MNRERLENLISLSISAILVAYWLYELMVQHPA